MSSERLSSASGDDATKATTQPWGELEVLCSSPVEQEAISVTPNEGVLSLLFNDLLVDLQDWEAPLTASRIALLHIPLQLPDDRTLEGCSFDLRGFVSKTAGTRAVLFTDLGGGTRMVEFPYGQTKEANFTHTFSQLEEGGAVPCAIAILLLLQRRSPEEGALLTVDSLDVTAQYGQITASSHAPEDSAA